MSGLVGYGSSGEEDDDTDIAGSSGGHLASETPLQVEVPEPTHHLQPNASINAGSRPALANNDATSQSSATNGAILGPQGPSQAFNSETDVLSTPTSLYTTQRAIIRDLTMPTDPKLDIPPSPPGSPAPGIDQKFSHFLQLKKQGVHFNSKLASSSALKNPSLLPKLMDFAGVDEQKQYMTTLPPKLWDLAGILSWAYKEELLTSQEAVSKEKEEERLKVPRENIDFVSASNHGQSSRGASTGAEVGVRGAKNSAAERILDGLSR